MEFGEGQTKNLLARLITSESGKPPPKSGGHAEVLRCLRSSLRCNRSKLRFRRASLRCDRSKLRSQKTNIPCDPRKLRSRDTRVRCDSSKTRCTRSKFL